MPDTGTYEGWNYTMRIVAEEDGRVSEYSINFYRDREQWFDEIRYDSHERRRSRKVPGPHFHMKLQSSFKGDPGAALEQIKSMIDNYLQKIQEVIET